MFFMTGNEIRRKFIEYFNKRDHSIIKSSPLVPKNDPTLLFTNAGMAPFKDIFLGKENPPNSRAVSVQKCVRAGGKHNDLEMVGRTKRHHTFFEMLGNFSFGDYFKKEAIYYGWEFLTEEIDLPKKNLYASVFMEDEEAFAIWRDEIGLAENRICRMGEKDNFWSMGPTGPCGPCSEIYFDQGESVGCGKQTCAVGCNCDRYLEIWNLVFMQYNRGQTGVMESLPNPCIDTGMGLERITAVVQNKTSNYDSDLIMDIIENIADISCVSYGKSTKSDVSIRVIADHVRAVTFLISDGVLPSNEGRGYVLRRIIRRALRHGKLLGIRETFMNRIADKAIDRFCEAYPELKDNRVFIEKVLLNEEESFRAALNFGTQRLDEILDQVYQSGSKLVPGEKIFKLYDTYGFPTDLAEEISHDWGFTLDMDGFNKAMQEQKERALASWKGSGEKQIPPFYKNYLKNNPPTRFLGYDQTKSRSQITAMLKNQKEVESAAEGETVEILFECTPFYGESGGQIGDKGYAEGQNVQLEILNTTKPIPELIVHHTLIQRGTLKKDDTIELIVNTQRRQKTTLNHTATHMLHAALKEVLGEHIKQAGSLVAEDRLRFDYTHFSPMSNREKNRIETIVNEKIRDNISVNKTEMGIDEALEKGAMALFGEKYGDKVRVVSVGTFSKELCGGTHTQATGDIGLFKIIGEGSIASGVRRIEAVTGLGALEKVQKEIENLTSMRNFLKAQPDEELGKLKNLVNRNRELEKEIEALKEKFWGGKGKDEEILSFKGFSAIIHKLEDPDAKALRTFIDNCKNRLKTGVVIVGGSGEGKVLIAVGVTQDLTNRFHAGNIVKVVAEIIGGGGGGRPDMAQAGGNKPEMLDEALKKGHEILTLG
tara:strand:- start:222 stop:2861 length:2640 start_codon:yes stop_codon:yes gene_type:complete